MSGSPTMQPRSNSDIKLNEIKRNNYLRAKGIKPSEQFQLDLVFPKTIGLRGEMRHIPNDIARASMFTVGNKRMKRETLENKKLFHYNKDIVIEFTGVELRADDDEIIWLQILKYGETVPLGKPFQFSVKDLVRDVNWSKNSATYTRARACISRLKATEVRATSSKAYGRTDAFSLIDKYIAINSAEGKPIHYEVLVDPSLIYLFAGNTFTSLRWSDYCDLSPIARRLADYLLSHKDPYPLSIHTFKQICSSMDSNERSWRQSVRKACAELQKRRIVSFARLDANDMICCVRGDS